MFCVTGEDYVHQSVQGQIFRNTMALLNGICRFFYKTFDLCNGDGRRLLIPNLRSLDNPG